MELPKANEIKWLQFGTHNGSYRNYVKKGDQWYLLTHDEGWIDSARKVDEEMDRLPGRRSCGYSSDH